MRAACWFGRHDIRVETVPDPVLLEPTDIIVRVTLTAICGSDLHLYNGFIPAMEPGDVLGHEFMGIVVDVGRSVKDVRVGDRVVVPFTISCGKCRYCTDELWSLCDNSNPNASMAESLWGFSPAALFGYSHLVGGFAGGQAEYVRVPFGDVGPLKVPQSLTDEQALFLSDVLPTGYQAAEQAKIRSGDTVAVWGCGPVGQFAIQSAHLFGAGSVIAIDSIPERLAMASEKGRAKTINFMEGEVYERLREMTGGRGPDVVIDAVGLESHGMTFDAAIDKAKTALMLATDRPHALREAIYSCRKGGTVSIPGVYGGFLDKFPLGAAFNKGLTLKMGQTHVPRHMPKLLQLIEEGSIDPTFIISHRLPLAEAPRAYQMFNERTDRCTKVVLQP